MCAARAINQSRRYAQSPGETHNTKCVYKNLRRPKCEFYIWQRIVLPCLCCVSGENDEFLSFRVRLWVLVFRLV